jgi:methylated-DNA-[protein]-cysteine S-methyltransferase
VLTGGFSLFDTPVGPCGIAWGPGGIVGLQLPEEDAAATRARLASRHPGLSEVVPPASVKRAIAAILALLAGKGGDLSEIALDLSSVPDFHRRVYELARAIPPGKTRSYGELATELGKPGAARAVGQAMGKNPFPIVVPCHRVLAAGGKIGGFSATGSADTKRQLLGIEGAPPPPGRDLTPHRARSSKRGFGFDPAVALAHVRASDPKMARLIDQVGPFEMKLDQTQSLFLALAEAIVFQQLHGKAAATIFGRVRALFPAKHGSDEGISPRAILAADEEVLRSAGLSRAKTLAIKDLSRRMEEGLLPTLAEVATMDDETVIARLTPVRGIGRWTVEMLLMFRLGRPDVLPVDDYGVRKGFQVTFGPKDDDELPAKDVVAARGKRWAPYRSLASWYLWRAADRAKASA